MLMNIDVFDEIAGFPEDADIFLQWELNLSSVLRQFLGISGRI